jgi:hypothetical protein
LRKANQTERGADCHGAGQITKSSDVIFHMLSLVRLIVMRLSLIHVYSGWVENIEDSFEQT